jgi:hypothetical protein
MRLDCVSAAFVLLLTGCAADPVRYCADAEELRLWQRVDRPPKDVAEAAREVAGRYFMRNGYWLRRDSDSFRYCSVRWFASDACNDKVFSYDVRMIAGKWEADPLSRLTVCTR